jgi:hypothetical protein
MLSSYAYAENMDVSTARRSVMVGDETEALVRKARRIRRNDMLPPDGPDVAVRRAVKVLCTRVRKLNRSFPPSRFVA